MGNIDLAEGAIDESETCLSQLEELNIMCEDEAQLDDACCVSKFF